MKTSLLSLAILFLITTSTGAQLRVAIVGGLNSASIKETNDLPGWDSIKNNYSSRTGVHFGFMADMRITPASKLYFQPGVMFSMKGRKYVAPYDSTGIIKTTTALHRLCKARISMAKLAPGRQCPILREKLYVKNMATILSM